MDLWHYRNFVAGAPLIFAFLSTQWWRDAGWGAWAVALAVVAAGVAVRAWSICHNRYGRGTKKTLAVSGPYALVRNPMYWGNTLIIAGAVIASELTWFVPFAVVWAFLVYDWAAKREERRLESKYGEDWVSYRDAVPRWFPNRLPGLERLASSPALFARTATLQAWNAIVLVPFVLKDINAFSFWRMG